MKRETTRYEHVVESDVEPETPSDTPAVTAADVEDWLDVYHHEHDEAPEGDPEKDCTGEHADSEEGGEDNG